MFLTNAMLCLALNIYHESRSEPLVGQHAVAQVTMNRAGRDPNKLCETVFKPKQFSWANPLTATNGKKRERLAKRYIPTEEKAWDIARQIAYHTVKGHVRDFTKGAMFYHTHAVKPHWAKTVRLVAIIGQHRFYV